MSYYLRENEEVDRICNSAIVPPLRFCLWPALSEEEHRHAFHIFDGLMGPINLHRYIIIPIQVIIK